MARLLRAGGDEDASLALATTHADEPDVDPLVRRNLHTIRAKILERRGDADASFAAYEAAQRSQMQPWRGDVARKRTDELIAAFSRERMATLPRAGTTGRMSCS